MTHFRVVTIFTLFFAAIAWAEVQGKSCIPEVSETIQAKCVIAKDGDTISVLAGKQVLTVQLEGSRQQRYAHRMHQKTADPQ